MTISYLGMALVPLGAARGPDDLILAEYDMGQLVDFEAILPAGSAIEASWEASEPDLFGRMDVRGQVQMTVRLGVLFDDELGLLVDQLSWRRSDGYGPGQAPFEQIPGQLPLFDKWDDG